MALRGKKGQLYANNQCFFKVSDRLEGRLILADRFYDSAQRWRNANTRPKILPRQSDGTRPDFAVEGDTIVISEEGEAQLRIPRGNSGFAYRSPLSAKERMWLPATMK